MGRDSDSSPHGGVRRAVVAFVSFAAWVWAVGAVVALAPMVSPTLTWDGDVINQAIVRGHAKAGETLIFMMACLLVPAACAAAVVSVRASRPVWGFLAACALLSWPLHRLVGWPAWAGVAGAAIVFTALSRPRLPRRRVQETTPASSLPRGSAARHVRWWHGAGATILLAGIGVASVAAPRTHGTLASLRGVTALTLLCATAASAALWGAIWRVVAWCGRGDSARRAATAGLLPLGALVVANFDPCEEVLRAGTFAMLAGAVAVGIMVALRARRVPRLARRLFWWGYVPAVLYAATYLHDTRGPVDLYHDGERLTPGAAIAGGAIPFKDVFLWHGLVENGLLPAVGLRSEWSVHGVRVVQRLVEPLATVALYALLAGCVGSQLGGTVATVYAVFALPPANGRYWLPYLAYAALAVWLSRREGGHRWAAAAGFCAAAAAFHSLDGGASAMLAVPLCLAYGATFRSDEGRHRWVRGMAAAGVGALLGASIPLAYLAARGAVADFFTTSASIVGGLSDRSSSLFPPPPRLEGGILAALVRAYQGKVAALYLPAVVIVWGLAHVTVRRVTGQTQGSSRTLPVVVLGAAAFFRAVIRRPDTDHVTKVLPLVFAVAVVLAVHHVARAWAARRSIMALPHAAAAAALALVVARLTMIDPGTAPARIVAERTPHEGRRDAGGRELHLKRAGPGVEAEAPVAAWIEEVVRYLEASLAPDETFYDFTNSGLLYFLADRPCPTRYAQTTYAASQAAQREVIASLRANRPRLVLFPTGDENRYGYDQLIHPLRHPLITRHLYRHYAPSEVVGDAIILEDAARAGGAPPPQVMRFIASTPFVAEVGHLPLLYGQIPWASERVMGWEAPAILEWRGSEGLRLGQAPSARAPTVEGHAELLVSPLLAVEPTPDHVVVVHAGCDVHGGARLLFGSVNHDAVDGSASLGFWMAGDTLRTYVLDVGLLPAWVWRGPVTHLGLQFPRDAHRVVIHSIELRARAPDNVPAEAPHARSRADGTRRYGQRSADGAPYADRRAKEHS